MVARNTHAWFAADALPILGIVYAHIGATWEIADRERIFKEVSYAMFPPHRRSDAWCKLDSTYLTQDEEFYYPITVRLMAPPNVWFKNLRLLQIRRQLNLVTNLEVTMGTGNRPAAEICAKMSALRTAVGSDLVDHMQHPPLKRRPMMMSSQQRLPNLGAENHRNRGLAILRDRQG